MRIVRATKRQVVFLPAAGNRNGSTVNNAGTNGNYWSSTPNTSNASNAYNLNFNSSNVNPSNNNNRYNGNSVRLVTALLIIGLAYGYIFCILQSPCE